MGQKHTPRLLVVDDDLGVISAYRLVLEGDSRRHRDLYALQSLESELFGGEQSAGPVWRITFLDQGADAVQVVKWAVEDRDPFTAIFLDVRMPPGLDGYETASELRKIDPDLHIVIVTGYNDYDYEDFLAVAGPESKLTYMTKPVWPDQLKKVAQFLVGEQQSGPARLNG